MIIFLSTTTIYGQDTPRVRPEVGPSAEELKNQKLLETLRQKSDKLDRLLRDNNLYAPSIMGFFTSEREVVNRIINDNQHIINKINTISELRSLSKEVHDLEKQLHPKTSQQRDAVSLIEEKANENIRRGRERLSQLEEKENKIAEWNLNDDKNKSNSGWGRSNDGGSDPWGNAKKVENDWSGISKTNNDNSTASKSYKIESRDGKYGVLSSNGKTLIPFKFDQIEKYDQNSGLAVVSFLVDRIFHTYSCTYKGSVSITIGKQGVVDSNGNWVTQPSDYAAISYSAERPPAVIMMPAGEPYDPERMKRIREDQNNEYNYCLNIVKEKANSFKIQYSNKGYSIK